MRNLTLIIILALSWTNTQAQDPHFSQFFASPLTLNPALTGKFDGDIRVTGNYRNQWPSINRAFITSTISVDFPILKNHIGTNDTWGFGIMAYADKSANGALSQNYLSASTSYHLALNEDGYTQIGIGFLGSYSNTILNTADLKFEDQLTPFGFTGPSGETFNGATLNSHYFDLNAGLLYSTSSSDRNYFYGGFSMYHVTRPKQTFTNNIFAAVNARTTLHAGGYFPLGDLTTVHLSALYSTQAKASETVFGGALQFALSEDERPVSVYLGSWMRAGDALIPYAGLEFSDFRLGLSYDVNTSSLKTASQQKGGLELSLNYIRRPPETRGLPCPKF